MKNTIFENFDQKTAKSRKCAQTNRKSGNKKIIIFFNKNWQNNEKSV